MIAQRLVREDHVVDRDRRPVGELGFRVQGELDGAPVLRHVDRLGDQPVEREGLVIGARHQALIDEVADALGGDTLDDEGVETVERPAPGQDQPAALWRVRIDVGEGGETLHGPRLAMHGDSRRGLRDGPSGRWQEGRNAKQKQRNQGFQGRARMAIDASALRHASRVTRSGKRPRLQTRGLWVAGRRWEADEAQAGPSGKISNRRFQPRLCLNSGIDPCARMRGRELGQGPVRQPARSRKGRL